MSETITREQAEAALANRLAEAPVQIDDATLPAGSPMHYYCGGRHGVDGKTRTQGCGVLIATLPESWYENPPPPLCEPCQEMKDAGWM